MSDKIEEIRERHAQSEKNYIELEATWKAQVHEDRAWLLAEDARHRAEIERLRVALREFACSCSSLGKRESLWNLDGECRYLTARRAVEGKP